MLTRALWRWVYVFAALLLFAPRSLGGDVYRLDDPARYSEGCFPPCLCPLRISEDLCGTFGLDLVRDQGGVIEYRVSRVNWYVTIGSQEVTVSGEGQYRLAGQGSQRTQEMSLTLSLGGKAPVKFGSGVVPAPNFPLIDLNLSTRGMVCLDRVFRVAASVVPKSRLMHYSLDAASEYAEGCLEGPCACPVWEVPLAGRFTLVPLTDQPGPYQVEYSVIDASFQTDPPVRSWNGLGLYRVRFAGPTCVQSMTLDLDEPTIGRKTYRSRDSVNCRFETEIDIDLAVNRFWCYDFMLFVRAIRTD